MRASKLVSAAVFMVAVFSLSFGYAFAGPPEHANGKAGKEDVCHYDADTDTFHLINVSKNALQAHMGHGDVDPVDALSGTSGQSDEASCPVWGVLETVEVEGVGGVVASTTVLTSGEEYMLRATGTYIFWEEQQPDAGIADAHCSLRPEGSFNAGPGPRWINGDDLTGYENYLEVQTSSGVIDWTEDCNTEHVYTADYVGDGSTVSFQILDSGDAPYPDNSGSVTVEIWGWS